MLVPSVQVKSDKTTNWRDYHIAQQYNNSDESMEVMWSYETIFKDGVKKTLYTLNDISQIPTGGKMIDYYRDEGKSKWQKIRPESIKAMWLPQKIDISPKNITGSVASMNLHLGSRTFNIEPWIGDIDAVILDKNALIIKTTLKDISYDKEQNLPRLLFKLWNTPAEKWKKSGFKGSTVTEI